MAITSTTIDDGRGMRISVSERFDFAQHKAFRDAYSQRDPRSTRYEIDLSRADYMDSSALGMLLLLRERAGGDKADITLTGFNETIGQILEIARFHELFKIK